MDSRNLSVSSYSTVETEGKVETGKTEKTDSSLKSESSLRVQEFSLLKVPYEGKVNLNRSNSRF